MNQRNLPQILERKVLQTIMSLPPELIRMVVGKPIVIDNQTLHPEMQLYLMVRKLIKKPAMGDLPPQHSRQSYVKDSLVHGIDIHDVETSDFIINDHLLMRLYEIDSRETPVIYYLHGGGFVIGDLEMFDHVCRFICHETGYKVLALNYRKAPEFPFPSGIEDGVAGYHWIIEKASEFGIDQSKIVICGDSAGANLATVVTQIICQEGLTPPKKQVLFYPTCDWSRDYDSTEKFGTGFFLTKKDFEYFASHYHGPQGCDLSHPWISPVHGKLNGLPETILVTAGFDPLRDQGEAYAERLRQEGVKVTLIREEGMIHGFINLIGFSLYSRSVVKNILSQLKF